MVEYTYYIAKNLPKYKLNYPVRIAAWGDEDGNSVTTTLEADGTYSTSLIKPYNTPPISIKYYRNLQGKIINKEIIAQNYDPRLRPWYLEAISAKHPVWTDVYYSYPYRNLTIASAVSLFNKQQKKLGVFEIEIKLIALSNFLSTTKISKNSQIFILNGKNELTVYPGMQKVIGEGSAVNRTNALKAIGKHWQVKAIELYNETNQDYFKYQFNNENYLAYFKTIPGLGNHGLKIGIVAPEDDFMGDLKRAKLLTQLFSLGILFIGIFLIRIFSNLITKPLNLVIEDTKRIKQFHLDPSKTIKSHVTEIIVLAEAMQSMKSNLKSFQRYVPTDLVRQLIQSGDDVKIGGTKRLVTAFFSDIRNFTDISENLDAECLMALLCEYFEELSKIITNEKGTIDKYIGDSIMAFWGAPIEDENHCINACHAALKCQLRLTELNEQWEKQNKPKLITGIGIHTGSAIIGNIGSSSRLNYTAVGDTINTASRLESLSKQYGSVIVVSEAVVNATQDQFEFRFIEQVSIRGKAGSYKIYELVGVKSVKS
jgi:adenylate cyclase